MARNSRRKSDWHLVTDHYREEEKQLRRRYRETIKENFPEQTARFYQTLGLFPFQAGRDGRDGTDRGRGSVVLIHGLDDPGKVWQNLAPALVEEGFDVWLMHYPNDQPVVESARLFFDELRGLRQRGILRISSVAHSMGGLVTREMLTRPDIGYERLRDEGQVPAVTSLTMVATPNHGSQLARFRVFGDLRDHLARLQKGETTWLGTIIDGAGEAKIDLLPGSRFLTELNARPHPDGLDLFIIAGISSPWSERDIRRWLSDVRREAAADQQQQVDALGDFLISMTHGLGDGLVSVDSTRLDGVPHRTVNGTHLSMIRNITASSRRVPPAVPIIVERLKSIEKPAKP